jgi:hypothetical protein
MSLNYVTLAQAKYQCRITPADTYHDDHLTNILIPGASGAIKNYLKNASPYEAERNSDDDYWLDSNLEPEVILGEGRAIKPEVKMATLLLIQIMFDTGGVGAEYAQGSLPIPVQNLLYPLRDPALA